MVNNNRVFKIGFFRAEEQKGSLKDILDMLLLKPVADRNAEIPPYPVRVEKLKEYSEGGLTFYEGDFVKLRMNNLPVKASKDAGVRAIGLKSDEGIGEETAFLYSPKHRVMLLQQNRVGTSYVKAADYFNWFGAGINIVGFSVMMKLDAIERLKKAKSFKSLSVSFSPVNCEKELANSGVAVKHAVDMVNGLGGERLSFTISLMPRKKGTLDKVGIKSVIRKLHDFCSGGKHDVTKLQLRAEDEDGASFIDFIRDRLVCTQEVAEDEERRLSYKTRINILRNAWNSKDFQNLIVQ